MALRVTRVSRAGLRSSARSSPAAARRGGGSRRAPGEGSGGPAGWCKRSLNLSGHKDWEECTVYFSEGPRVSTLLSQSGIYS